MSDMDSPQTTTRMRKLHTREITFFIICSILTVDALAPAFAIGVQILIAWCFGIVFFFLPYGLVTAELGSTYKGKGGIYNWVKLGLGEFSATMVSWIYWINVALWIPSVFVSFSHILRKVFLSQVPQDIIPYLEAILSLTMIWLTIFVGVRTRNVVELFTNTGAYAKIFVLTMLSALGLWYSSNHGFKTDFGNVNFFIWKPEILGLVPVIIFNFLGFEVISSLDDDMDNPPKDYPKAILVAGFVISIIYIFSSMGILASLDGKDVSIVSGISDALLRLTYESLGPGFSWLYYTLVIALLYGLFSTVLAWTVGTNLTLFETGLDEQIKIFSHRHKKYGSPDYAFYLMGGIASFTYLINFVGIQDVRQIFWTTFAISTFLFLIPYSFLFIAFLRLRYLDPFSVRPFKVPLGMAGAWTCAVLGFSLTVFACMLFFFSPSGIEDVTRYRISLIIGVSICLVLGSAIYFKKRL
jgi:amino acid transporter